MSGNEYPRDFTITSPVRSCILRAKTPAERTSWVESIKRAIRAHIERRATYAKAAMGASFEVDEAGTAPAAAASTRPCSASPPRSGCLTSG